ncbi:helix-turn-helix domain-containing protein [Streptomyces sp. DSM 44917]|uniref:Helix-turn-helix domain-containing protein n=1 Tax=Streptomyces boetiae TaxID=3075541 RepID=A0ABU2L8P9_9ACTN|nr:helix-turn-helix domain-containing protein [Streptomyces sp. DSM 44917]MDT0307955.1 helix-turn-helix domain-containing protein [Streptomyces sp. DSM 44917]
MTTTVSKHQALEPLGPIPKELAAIMRAELPTLIREIGEEIRRSNPEHTKFLNGPYGRAIQACVEQILSTFVDQVADPTTSTARRDEMCRRLGRCEALSGHSLDTLRASFQIGARVALRAGKRVGKRYSLSPALMLAFADALFAYIDELIEVAREGYVAVKAQTELIQQLESERRRLLRLILAGPAAPRAKVTELAERTGWPLPDEVTMVALAPDPQLMRDELDADALVDLSDPQPHLLIPGTLDELRRASLETALSSTRAVIGLTVPLEDAADSLRWARQALQLAETGIIEDDGPLIMCDDHLVTLWLLADPSLTEQLARRQLAPLAELTETQRERLIETLRAWHTTRGNAVEMADLLHLHPQTVRYRMRNLERIFGSRRLSDPDQRFATESVLRALLLREKATVLPLARQLAAGQKPSLSRSLG